MIGARWEIISLAGTLGPYAPTWDKFGERLFRSDPMLNSGLVDAKWNRVAKSAGDNGDDYTIYQACHLNIALEDHREIRYL